MKLTPVFEQVADLLERQVQVVTRTEARRQAEQQQKVVNMGFKRMRRKIQRHCFRPGTDGDLQGWCRECQRGNHARKPRAPLHPLPIIQEPFQQVDVDIVLPFILHTIVHCTWAKKEYENADWLSRSPECIEFADDNFNAKEGKGVWRTLPPHYNASSLHPTRHPQKPTHHIVGSSQSRGRMLPEGKELSQHKRASTRLTALPIDDHSIALHKAVFRDGLSH